MKLIIGVLLTFLGSSAVLARPEQNNEIPKLPTDSEEFVDFAGGWHSTLEENKLKSEIKNEKKCGYESCPTPLPNMLNVHLVPHTHDDVGWLKTFDQYYYGSKTLIQKAGVQYILDSVVQELLTDKNKKFIYVESAFFFKWWKEQTTELQDQVKELVEEGRLEFIGGAWSMNDEATTHYNSIVDQFTWGLRKLNDTFGECGRPKVGWQIDPFGHSREQASLFAQMGYDGMFFGRLDYQDKQNRMQTKKMEMIWQASPNLGAASDLFTGALFNNYGPPPGFCFDILCADEPFIDNKHSPDYNVDLKVDQFIQYVKTQEAFYRSNNLIITMGGDFTYMDAHVYYKNLDKLIRYANERSANTSVNLFYSTPSCYLKSLHDAKITWPTKTDDFFPYASDPHAFWTGYFTSRPTVKRMERVGNHYLQVCKQITALSNSRRADFEPHLNFYREAMGVMQHHDAVTGTEKQHVASDYARMLNVAMRACGVNTKVTLNQMTVPQQKNKRKSRRNWRKQINYHSDDVQEDEDTEYPFSFDSCLHLNISSCEISENSLQFIVTVYNPLAHSTYEYVRIPVIGDKYLVKDYRNAEVSSQIIPIPSAVQTLDFRSSNATFDLMFLAVELPPLGYKSFFVSRIMESVDDFTPQAIQMDQPVLKKNEELHIGNKNVNVSFDSDGFISSITTNGQTNKLSQKFFYYQGASGNNGEFLNRSSGAYIFRPNNTEQQVGTKATLKLFKGALVEEVHQTFSDWLTQVVRVHHDENFVEFEWMVGPIPIDDNVGKEVVTRFYTDIESNGVFYTDSNGREMLKRKRNQRATWNLKLEETVAGNYYPVTTKIAIEDNETRLAILTDRAQGGASLTDGALELMIHRRLLHDDAFGVEEALNERAFGKGLIVRGKHYMIFGSKKTADPTLEARERFLQNRKTIPAWLFFSDASATGYDDWRKRYNNIYSALTLSLPQNVHLLTLEPWKENGFLVRFEHLLEKNEDPIYSQAVKFNIQDVFRSFDVEDIRETTLAGNQWLNDAKRMKFEADPSYTDFVHLDKVEQPSTDEQTPLAGASEKEVKCVLNGYSEMSNQVTRTFGYDYEIVLQPMQIRTFVVSLTQKV